MTAITIFISDEGLGHKIRQSCIANELAERGVDVFFQTQNVGLVESLLDPRVRIKQVPGLSRLKYGQTGVDIDATSHSLSDYIPASKKWIQSMMKMRHVIKSDILVTDIVEEATVVARKLSKPIFAISHFTWHWFFKKLGYRFKSISAYLKDIFDVDGFLYPPFSKDCEEFPKAHAIDLIVREPQDRQSVRDELGVTDKEFVVAISKGENMIWNGIIPKIADLSETGLVFISNLDVQPHFRQLSDRIRFHDYINAADLVITKGGYSTLSECLAFGTRIMIVREQNHPETQENARLLKRANKAFVCNFDKFKKKPSNMILRAIETKIDCTPLKNDGQKQACDILLSKG